MTVLRQCLLKGDKVKDLWTVEEVWGELEESSLVWSLSGTRRLT